MLEDLLENPALFLAPLLGLMVGSFLNVVIYRLPVMLNNEWTQMAKEHLGIETDEMPVFNLIVPSSRCGN